MSRIISPYSQTIGSFFEELNKSFCDSLGLKTPFKYEDILPGERFGLITPRSYAPDSGRSPAHQNVRTGYEFWLFNLEILVVIGCNRQPNPNLVGRLRSEIAGCEVMLDIQNAIPALKQTLPNELIYDIQCMGEIAQVLRQSVRPPNHWMVDVTANAQAKLTIRRDAQGLHELPNWRIT